MKLQKMFLLGVVLMVRPLLVQGADASEVRGVFLKAGGAVLRYLETESGGKLVSLHTLSLPRLRLSLSANVVDVRQGPLTDNNGATVDALGGPGFVVLGLAAWDRFFEKEQDVYYLVFHEMLRAAGYNDDNYVISRPLYPFPFHLKVETRTQSVNEDTSGMPYSDRLAHLITRCEALTKKADEIQLDSVVPDLKLLTKLLHQMEDMVRESPASNFQVVFREPLDKAEKMLNTTARIIRYVTQSN